MSVNEIVNGNSDFKGLIHYVRLYLDTLDNYTDQDRKDVEKYLQLFVLRASGKLMTPATWTRKFVTQHKEYKMNSVVNERINYDLMCKLLKVANGEEDCPEMLP